MKVFIDTEFSDFFQLELISLGMVTDDGRHCYVELSEGWTRDKCSAFVQEEVLPLLDRGFFGIANSPSGKRRQHLAAGTSRTARDLHGQQLRHPALC